MFELQVINYENPLYNKIIKFPYMKPALIFIDGCSKLFTKLGMKDFQFIVKKI